MLIRQWGSKNKVTSSVYKTITDNYMNLHVVSTLSINGEVTMPRSKTHSFRALVLASLADGISIVRQPKLSNDWLESVRAMRLYGAKINEIENNVFQVEGVAGNPQTPSDIINVNNSGTMLFFIAGVAAACPGISIITGDESIQHFGRFPKSISTVWRTWCRNHFD